MLYSPFTRLIALSAVTALWLGAAEVQAAELNTANFTAACVGDPVVADDPAFEGGKATPKAYCECVTGKLVENKLSQADVDMLTKMHNEAITDADAETYPTLEDLLVANEGYEDACKESLGLAPAEGTDVEESPMEDEVMPEEDMMPEDDAPGAEDEGSPPE
jgi:hypothetical protein